MFVVVVIFHFHFVSFTVDARFYVRISKDMRKLQLAFYLMTSIAVLLQQTKWKCLWMKVNRRDKKKKEFSKTTANCIDIYLVWVFFRMSQNTIFVPYSHEWEEKKGGCDHCVSMISFCAIPFCDYIVVAHVFGVYFYVCMWARHIFQIYSQFYWFSKLSFAFDQWILIYFIWNMPSVFACALVALQQNAPSKSVTESKEHKIVFCKLFASTDPIEYIRFFETELYVFD